jgi:hypothetical protein
MVKPSNEQRTIFWINIYNFLCIYTLILKNEIPASEYQYNNILKNSYYNIGNYVISIESIEEIIIKGTYDKSKKKDSFIDYKGMFLNEKTFLNIEKNKNIILVALSKPFK